MKRFIALTVLAMVAGCAPDPKSGKGFTLPDGDAQAGKATFVRLQCNACHRVEGVTFDTESVKGDQAAGDESAKRREEAVVLGGEKAYVETYGDLVTSIINPSHRFAAGYPDDTVKTDEGESQMRLYNDVMTVTELIDLVTFLQQHYRVRIPDQTPYVPYY